MKRLQEDEAGEGSGLTRRRSCSMHMLYNMAEMNSKPGRDSRLKNASNANTEGIEVSLLSTSHRAHVDPSSCQERIRIPALAGSLASRLGLVSQITHA